MHLASRGRAAKGAFFPFDQYSRVTGMTNPPTDFDLHAQEPLPDAPAGDLEDQVLDALRTVFDPEIPVNIVDLGLIYDLRVLEDRRVFIDMTLTAPNCPVAEEIPIQVADKVKSVPGVVDATVSLVWMPPWTQDRMSEEARLQLNLF
jgi:FeS assembly SUF system protein